MYLRKILLLSSFFGYLSPVQASNTYDHDLCQNILRDGVKDDLASNSSKRHLLVKHHQFCAIAKKHNLSETNFDNFAKAYSKQTVASHDGSGAEGGVDYGLFSASGGYSQDSSSSSLSENERIAHLKKKSLEILDYYTSNCGNSSYEEHLEIEANLTTRIASNVIVNSWRECMVKKHGTFAYPIFSDEDLLQFSVRIEYLESGTRHIKSLFLEWFGDNISTICDEEKVLKKAGAGRRTDELLNPPERVILSGANLEIPLKRTDNNQNDMVWVHTMTGDGITNSFSFKLPKMIEFPNVPLPKGGEFVIEHYCANPECPNYDKRTIEKPNKKSEHVFTQLHLYSHICEKCKQTMETEYKFRNCLYHIIGKTQSGNLKTYPWTRVEKFYRSFLPDQIAQNSLDPWRTIKIEIQEKDAQVKDEDF